MSSSVWTHLGMCGSVWNRVEQFGTVWKGLEVSESVCNHQEASGKVQLSVGSYWTGIVWERQGPSGTVWRSLTKTPCVAFVFPECLGGRLRKPLVWHLSFLKAWAVAYENPLRGTCFS